MTCFISAFILDSTCVCVCVREEELREEGRTVRMHGSGTTTCSGPVLPTPLKHFWIVSVNLRRTASTGYTHSACAAAPTPLPVVVVVDEDRSAKTATSTSSLSVAGASSDRPSDLSTQSRSPSSPSHTTHSERPHRSVPPSIK